MLRLYNTLTRSIEEFTPIHGKKVGMYSCGPTVYDHMHIGNLRTFVLSNILYQVLTYNHYEVTSVQNITDIDDKIIKRAKERSISIEKVASQYTELFIEDMGKLNIRLAKGIQPKATEYVSKMVDFIIDLMSKGLAYKEKDGSVYFDISKFPDYGKLSHIEKKELKSGTRVLSDEYTKEDIQDFALWKAIPEGEVGSFPSELGWGRPGWHIECSAMSQEILGNRFDIHVGGIDLIFPHHENEIAQSEGRTGEKPFVKYWVHGAHILVNGKKMSKSLKNFYTLTDISKQKFDPLTLKYLYLQTHYRQEMNFTWEALEAAQTAYRKLLRDIAEFTSHVSTEKRLVGCAEFEQRFLDAINDDLNMPKALAVVWELVKSDYPASAKLASMKKFDVVLGLELESKSKIKIQETDIKTPKEIEDLVQEREVFRKAGDWTAADELRKKIHDLGYVIEDSKEGTKVRLLET